MAHRGEEWAVVIVSCYVVCYHPMDNKLIVSLLVSVA